MTDDFPNATPRPWHVTPWHVTPPTLDRGLAFIHGLGENSEIIATLYNRNDAHLIVAAVNAYGKEGTRPIGVVAAWAFPLP